MCEIFLKSKTTQSESVPNMSPYMDRRFFGPGYTPPHGLAGRYYFSTQRASGEMNYPSQFFSIPLRYTVRLANAMAMAQYLRLLK